MTTATIICLSMTGAYLIGLGIFSLVKYIKAKKKFKKEKQEKGL